MERLPPLRTWPGQGPLACTHFLTQWDVEEGESGTIEAEVRLDQVLTAPGGRFFYTYDFGIGWAHTITVEAVRSAPGDDPPAHLIKLVRACPPEDVGGIRTWNDLGAAPRGNPDPSALTGDLEMFAGWLSEDFHPDEVDLDGSNLQLDLVGADIDAVLAAFPEMPAPGGWPVAVPDLAGVHPWVAALLERAPADLVVGLAALIDRATAPGHDVPAPSELRVLLRPWQTLLDVAGAEGILLTPAGWMALAACERLWHQGGLDWGYRKGSREQHTPGTEPAEKARHPCPARPHLPRTARCHRVRRARRCLGGQPVDGPGALRTGCAGDHGAAGGLRVRARTARP